MYSAAMPNVHACFELHGIIRCYVSMECLALHCNGQSDSDPVLQ